MTAEGGGAAQEDGNAGLSYQLKKTLSGHERAVSSVKFSACGTRLASSSADKTVRVWDVETGEELQCLRGHKQGVSDVCWSSDGQFLASASDDKNLILWEVETGAALRTLEGHTNYVFCCCFNPQGNMLVSGSFDETVRVWDTRSGRILRELPAHSDPVTAVQFSYDGKLIVSSSFDGLCRMWDTDTGQCMKTLIPPGNPPVSYVRFTKNGRFLLVCTLTSTIELWDYQKGKRKGVYKGHENTKFCLHACFESGSEDKPHKPWVICGSEDHGIYAWDLNSMQVVLKLEGRTSKEAEGDGHCSPVLAVDTTESHLLASGSLEGDCTIKIWGLEQV